MGIYRIPELKITIEAKDDKEFQEKKKKLMERNIRFTTGGVKNTAGIKIKDY